MQEVTVVLADVRTAGRGARATRTPVEVSADGLGGVELYAPKIDFRLTLDAAASRDLYAAIEHAVS